MWSKKINSKIIVVTGGVISSLGKGIVAASLGYLLKNRGLKVSILKMDPYINVDPGTMSPFQHGEVYVTDDGAETDLDLGHYERFLNQNMSKLNNVTTGQIYYNVIKKEREGKYLGATVQVVPHIINEIIGSIYNLYKYEKPVDVIIIEIGGTIGDIESLPFVEAMRQLRLQLGKKNFLSIHVSLVPYIKAAGEIKTKPTQHSVNKLREIGIQPDFIICRTEKKISNSVKEKIGLFCNVNTSHVIECKDVPSIYEVPISIEKDHFSQKVVDALELKCKETDLTEWINIVQKIYNSKNDTVNIALCGKYVHLVDAYKSINEAFIHAGAVNNVKVNSIYIDSEKVTSPDDLKNFGELHGILIPGGFGERGIEGKLNAIKFARENKIPFLGICLGMQCAVIEFARNVCNLQDANSPEFNPNTPHPVIHLMEEQKEIKQLGGTMRLGKYDCILQEDTNAFKAYKKTLISERHRHRFEFNPNYKTILEKNGLKIAGINPQKGLVEIIELKNHPWFVGVQFHPELKSRPLDPHPLFKDFIKAAKQYRNSKK